MAREIEPARRQANREIVREHPVMVAFAVSPALLVLAGVWWATSFWVALVLALVAGGAAAYLFLRK